MQVVASAGPISFLGRLLEVLWEDAVGWMNYLGKSNPHLTITACAPLYNVICVGPQVGRKGAAAISGMMAREGRKCC